MALVLKDRVKETTTTTGTGSFALAGAVTGYDSFGQIGNGNTTYYAVYLDGGSEWEVGIGTYTSPSTLSRDTILASSNAGSVVTFSAGQKTIWCDYPAGKAVYTDANGNVSRAIVDISAISGTIKTPESIEFDTNPSTIPTATGSLYWDNGNKTPSLILDADVTLQVGQENVVLVYNNSASTITNGSVVAVNGAQGQRPAVVLADADSEPLSAATLGIATEDIAAGAEGFVTTFGVIRGIDTSGFTAGNPIYLSSTAGQFTATRPSAPAHTVFLGWIIKVNASSGEVFVNISNGWELDELHNVLISSPTGGNLLAYDQTNQYWKNINLTDGTGISVTEATGGAVTITNTGVTALSAGTGITVSGSTGSVTVTNSAPDQTVSLTGAGTTTVTGTYPNFTITSNDQYVGTVTSVSALTLGTTGTDLSSTVANSTTTPVITLNVPTASATNRGALSSTDWTTFNNKAPAVTYTTNYVPYGQGTTTPNQSANLTFNGTTLTAAALTSTGVATFSAGTVSAPAITTTGDTNTGIFFPAADTIAFTEGGVESMRINSSGNVGIGETTPNNTLAIKAATATVRLDSSTGTNAVYSQFVNTAGSFYVGRDASNGGIFGTAYASVLYSEGAYPMNFYTNTLERMRIDSSGNLLVGATALGGDERLNVTKNTSGQEVFRCIATNNSLPWGMTATYTAADPNGTSNWFYSGVANGNVRFNVRSNGGIGNYSANDVNLSDAREKTNIELAGSYLDKICSIPVKTFNYIDQNRETDDGLTLGVIAQDVQAVAPELVTESNWGTKDEPKMRLSIYQTDLQYALMKCIQEQQAMIEELKAEVKALKGVA